MKKLSDRNKIQRLEKSDRVQRAKDLIEIVRKMDADGQVCDAIFMCKGWDTWAEAMRYRMFNFCPWCSAKLDWDWPRLRR
uniref:Uncharacterized protein n=1 Tax=viral metagenome TaxID=1070528 RepID=A0A6M3JMM1_9ZZZZ